MGFCNTPEFATAVVVINDRCLPGVLINVEVTLGIDVAGPFFQGCANMPYTVQLVASVILIDMTSLNNLVIAQTAIGQLVGVVRNVHFLLANQLPVVAIRSTVEHVEVIRSTHTVRRGTRSVIRYLRRPTNPTLTGVVNPRTARLGNLVDGLVYQQYVTGETCRSGNGLLEVK